MTYRKKMKMKKYSILYIINKEIISSRNNALKTVNTEFIKNLI